MDPVSTDTKPVDGAKTETKNGAVPPAVSKAIVPVVPEVSDRAISVFSGTASFETAQRMAKSLAASTLVPEAYRNNIPNVLIAIEIASRIGASVLSVMQQLFVIQSRPSWSSQFLIATVNASGRFTPLRFKWVGERGKDSWGCFAVAKDKSDGEECVGTVIDMTMAKAEGWTKKNGSKWLTMPDQMLIYRAAAFWTRAYAPELSLGISTSEEVLDVYGGDVRHVPDSIAPGNVADLEAELLGNPLPQKSDTATAQDAEIVEETNPVTDFFNKPAEVKADAEPSVVVAESKQPGDLFKEPTKEKKK